MSSSVSSHSAVATVMSSSVSSRSAVATVMSSSVSSRSAVAASQCSETTGDSELTAEDVSTVRKGRLILDEEESDAGCYQVVMCIVYSGGKVGLAYYQVESAFLYVMADMAEAEDLGLLRRVLDQVGPSVILISSVVDSSVQKMLTEYAERGEAMNASTDNSPKIEILPSSDFKYEQCKRRVISQPYPGVDRKWVGEWEELNDEQRLVLVSSLVQLDCVNMVRAMGVLLKYVDKRRLGVELEDRTVRVPILALKHFTLENLMVLDENTYCSLQIFQKETHPSVYKSGKGSTKEGLSLFGIANKTRSPLGRQLFKFWFLRPLCDLHTLQERQDVVAFLSSARQEETCHVLQDCIKHVTNIPRILVRMTKSHATVNDWKAVYRTAYNGVLVGDMCRSLPSSINIFRRIGEGLSEDLHRITSLIDSVVDFEESQIHLRFCVKPNVDTELDQKRSLLHGLPDLMTKVAAEELHKMNYMVSECNVIYYPQLGFLLTLTEKEAEGKQELFEELNMELKFLADGICHFKTEHTREMDSTLGDAQFAVLDHETAILYRLQDVILEQSQTLLTAVELTAELDCLLSLAEFAKEYTLVRPEFVKENVIFIKGGRHILQELCVSPFVPNDSCFSLEHGRMKILTGPNASGKSVYLKQNGLIVFLAHIGSFVPAEKTRLGLVESIFTRIQSRETVSVGLSTFMLDLNQVSRAVNLSTPRSLVLMDEFGKGTATVDGLSLLAACLKHFLSKGEDCPNILVSTHFHSLVKQNLIPSSPLVEYLTMDCLQEDDELVFLYQLVKGQTSTSYACQVAAAMGLPPAVVARGAQVTDLISRNRPIPKMNAEGMEKQQKVCETIVGNFLSLDLNEARDSEVESFLRDFVLTKAEGIL